MKNYDNFPKVSNCNERLPRAFLADEKSNVNIVKQDVGSV